MTVNNGGKGHLILSQLMPFSFKGHPVRVVLDEQGEPWWIAKDVADILGFVKAPDMIRLLDEDEFRYAQYAHLVKIKGLVDINPRGMTLLNESGLYHAILVSRKPEAKAFRKWVTAEVLPAIRRMGGYQLSATGNNLESQVLHWLEGYFATRFDILEKNLQARLETLESTLQGIQHEELLHKQTLKDFLYSQQR